MSEQNSDRNHLYRMLPQLAEVLSRAESVKLLRTYPRALVADAARALLATLRDRIKQGLHTEATVEQCLMSVAGDLDQQVRARLQPSLRRVINATGVILQTNLGRAPLSEAAIRSVEQVARGYCNLEVDLETGQRSYRDAHVEGWILELFALRNGVDSGDIKRSHAVAVVNNCAGATFLALNTLAEGGEVIVSRGELIEIGGGFRIPDILRKSGAVLREVGTTNRTRISDYAAAIVPATRLILRVHRSNFSMEGFTEQPPVAALLELSRKTSVPVFEDQGTGCVEPLVEYGMKGESSWVESAGAGLALLAASGDKLFGGPQCGVLFGERGLIERIRTNPLYRALRVDKLTYAALQATLLAYLREEEATLPVIAMLRMPAEIIQQRCEHWASVLCSDWLAAEVVETRSLVGGGTTPGASLASFAVALQHAQMSEGALAACLRRLNPPVVARTSGGLVLLDLRTVSAADDEAILSLMQAALGRDATGPER